MASLWEISIKASLGKLNFPPADDPDLPALLCAEGFDVQPISWPVIRRASQFPGVTAIRLIATSPLRP